MSVKPILFNTDMVRAILDDRKTVTRRVLRGEAQNVASDYVRRYSEDLDTSELIVHWWVDTPLEYYVPYRPGDILWVRETWAYGCTFATERKLFYRADGDSDDVYRWHPSIHMPREAARIFLRVTDVRVERLQNIDADGIRSEGLTSACVHAGDMEIATQEFALLWDSTIKPADRKKYGWAANPWVWVIEFERCNKPEEG